MLTSPAFVPRWMKRSSQVFIKLIFSLFDLNLPLLEPEVSKAFAGFFMSNNMASYRVSVQVNDPKSFHL